MQMQYQEKAVPTSTLFTNHVQMLSNIWIMVAGYL